MKYTLWSLYEVYIRWYFLVSFLRSPYFSAVAFQNFLNISPPLPACSGTLFDLLVLQAVCLFIVIHAICAHGKLIGTLSSQKTQDNSAQTDYDSILYLKQIPISDKYLKINLCFSQSSQSCYQNCSSWESEIFLSLLTYWFNLYSGHRENKGWGGCLLGELFLAETATLVLKI